MKNQKLYIIGNGFDLAHKLPTKYEDFYTWLNGTNYQASNTRDYSMFSSLMDEIFAHANDGKRIEWWSDFENALGHLQIDKYIESVSEEYEIKDPEDEHYKDPSAMAEHVLAHVEYFTKPEALDEIQQKFAEWVQKGIPFYDDIEPCFTDEDIDLDGLYLTFNYTDTLEKVYRVNPNNVLHIHGQASNPDSKIVVGHRTQYDQGDYVETEEKLFGVDADIFPLVVTAMNGLRKPIEEIVANNHDWFESLVEQNITEIHLYGLSFGEIDDEYFKEIHKLLPDANWIFAIHANGERTQKRSVRRINEFIKRIGIDKTKCSAFDQDSIYNDQIEL